MFDFKQLKNKKNNGKISLFSSGDFLDEPDKPVVKIKNPFKNIFHKKPAKEKKNTQGTAGDGWAKNHKKLIVKLAIAGAVLICLLLIALYIEYEYEVTSVTVMGNNHYTSNEIEEIVFDKPYTYNSLILKLKYNNKSIENVPFIERIDVDIVNPNKVRINVYEKAIAGYVEYLGHYMYFDKDGIVVESSNQIIDGIPYVTGLDYDHVVLHKPLPVDDARVFLIILDITQLLNKYEIATDRISFDSSGKITLYFGSARVMLGDDSYIDEKINEMHLLLGELEGYSGVLHMENYNGEETNFSFDKDEEEVVEETSVDIGADGEIIESDSEE